MLCHLMKTKIEWIKLYHFCSRPHELYLNQRLANIFCKGQRVNTLRFATIWSPQQQLKSATVAGKQPSIRHKSKHSPGTFWNKNHQCRDEPATEPNDLVENSGLIHEAWLNTQYVFVSPTLANKVINLFQYEKIETWYTVGRLTKSNLQKHYS